MDLKYLHYGTQSVDQDEIDEVLAALKSDFLSQGPKIRELEEQIMTHTGAQYCVAVSSGTAALHLAVKALDIPTGKEGVTSPLTFVASSNCFIYNGLKPVFADIDESTFCIDPAQLEKAVTPDTGVIIPVHFAGQPCDMEAIGKIAGKDIAVIEDGSHAIGSKFENGKLVGSCCYSDLAVFSFHPVKTVTTGEGGAITTNDKTLYEKLLMLRNHGITREPGKLKSPSPGPWYYEMQELGFNYRITDLQAAMGVAQFKRLDGFVARRREIIECYVNAFKDIPWLTLQVQRPGVFSALHLYVVKIDFEKIGKTRTAVMTELKEKKIGTQVHYIPVHLQPYYRENYGCKPGDFPAAEQYYEQCLSIPLYPKMTDGDVQRVIDAIAALKE